ncbi:MAG: NAD(P)H-dependent oxidoreductase [Pseudorhodobacter sp.]
MKILIVFAHPCRESYGAALFDATCKTLTEAGHDLRLIDLYREGFNPVLSEKDWKDYLTDTPRLIGNVHPHAEALTWAEGLILIFPTWYYGPPAILKGWLDRVWLPGVAFDIPAAQGKRATGKLRNIRAFTVITTSGSPWWWLRLIRDPGRSMLMRGMRVLFHPRCRMRWMQLHDMNHRSEADRIAFLSRLRRHLPGMAS